MVPVLTGINISTLYPVMVLVIFDTGTSTGIRALGPVIVLVLLGTGTGAGIFAFREQNLIIK